MTVNNSNVAPVLVSASPSLGTIDIKTAKTIVLSTALINNGAGTTTITDSVPGAVVGGIAVTGTTGKGTWSYSLDGTTFTAIGAVADTSALLLPKTASLRYTPDGADAETPTITYCAWDTTTGQAGTKVDASVNGGTTAFSTATDTAHLTVVSSSLSGYVYLDENHNGVQDSSEPGLAGVTVRLFMEDGSGNWDEVTAVSPTQSNSSGYYQFEELGAGAYQIRVDPCTEVLAGQNSLGTVAGTKQGTATENQFQLQLTPGENGSSYSFGFLGLQPSLVSLRLFLTCTPPMPQVIQGMQVAPTVSLGGASTTTFAETYTTEGAPTAIVSSGATLSSPDSGTLASMTVTTTNLLDGSSEQLRAVTTGTSIASNYANGVLTLTGVADVATYQTVLQSITYGDTAAAPTLGGRTITVVVNDGTTASAAATSTMTVVKGSAPSGYTITADESTWSKATAASAGFEFNNAMIGATYAYTVSSSAGGTPVTSTGTVTSATQDVTGINLSALPDGTLTYSVTLTDPAGNAGPAATATSTLDQTPPSGYAIKPDSTTLSSTSAASTGFTFAAAPVGSTYAYTVSSSAGGTPVTGSGMVNSATQNVTGINLSSLPAGTLTYSVTLTDPAGNVGAAVTATATLG